MITTHSGGHMPALGRYCLDVSSGRYYNSLHHKVIEEADLEQELMLAGQERQALFERVSRVAPAFVVAVASWECNLRCPHCYVGHLLERPSGDELGSIPVADFISLLRGIKSHPGWGLGCCLFIGGEPMLHPGFIDATTSAPELAGVDFEMTTNGIWDFDASRKILKRLKQITFSIDGLPEDHNLKRRPLYKSLSDPFAITYKNVRRATRELPGVDVVVQGTMPPGKPYSEKECARWYALMLFAGVKKENCLLLSEAPTARTKDGVPFEQLVAKEVRARPCCDYTPGKMLVVYQDKIYSSYYHFSLARPLASITDDPGLILQRQKDRVLAEMPVLADEVCSGACPDIGNCWGGCSHNLKVWKDNQPSSCCDRDYRHAKLLELVAQHR